MAMFVVDTFKAQFPGPDHHDDKGTYRQFGSQDSTYKVYVPTQAFGYSDVQTFEDSNDMLVTLTHNHERGGPFQIDDVAVSSVRFDGNAKLIVSKGSMSVQIDNGSPTQIPDWIPKAIDIGVEVLGALGALETFGISEEAAQEIVEDIKWLCNAFDKVTNWMAKWTDDGGRLNFPAVIAHDLNKLCVAVVPPYPMPSFGSGTVGFDRTAFAKAMDAQSGKGELITLQSWSAAGDSFTTDGKAQLVYSANNGDGGYATWSPDVSICRGGAAVMVSCKIDQHHSPKDNHLVLMAVFNLEGHAIAAQAGVQQTKDEKRDRIAPIFASFPGRKNPDAQSDTDLFNAVATALTKLIDGMDYGSDKSFVYLAEIAKLNVHALQKGVTL